MPDLQGQGKLLHKFEDIESHLHKLSVCLWDCQDIISQGTTVLNNLRDILQNQLYAHDELRWIKLKFTVKDWSHLWFSNKNPLQLIFLLLIDVFSNNDMMHRNEFLLHFEMNGYFGENLFGFTVMKVIEKLLNVLYAKVNNIKIKIDLTNKQTRGWFTLEHYFNFSKQLLVKDRWMILLPDKVSNCQYKYSILILNTWHSKMRGISFGDMFFAQS